MPYGDDSFSMEGDDSLFMPEPMQVQQALANNVRRNPALVMPSSGVQTPRPRPAAPAAAPTGPQVPTSSDFLRQLTERMYQRPDTQAYVQQARERGEQSDRDLILGLTLGAKGGEAFQPASGQFLKRALDKGSDYEIPGGWGHVSRSGEVVWNPAKLQENELSRLTKLYDISSGEETKREVARQRREDLAVAREGVNAQRQSTQDNARYRIEDNARNHFDQVTKDTRDVLNTARAVQALPTDGRLSPVQQQSLIIMLNKFQDPGSVVREGEFDRVAAAQGLMQKWGNLPQRIMSGQPLPPALVRDIQQVIKLYTTAAENTMRTTAADYVNNARQRGLDPNQIVTDRRWHPQASTRPDGAGASGRGTAESPISVKPRGGAAPGAQRDVIDVNF